MTSPAVDAEPGRSPQSPVILIKEVLEDYITCEAHMPPVRRKWHRGVVCGAMVPTRGQTVPIICPACGSRVL